MPSKREKLHSLFPAIRPKLLALPGGPKVHAPTDMLGSRHFNIAIGIAIGLHIVGGIIWQLSPKTEVVEIPVHVLSVKLGDSEGMSVESVKSVSPDSGNTSEVEKALASLVRDENASGAPVTTVVQSMDDLSKAAEEQAMRKHILPAGQEPEVLKQFVRLPAVQAKDSATSSEQKEVVARYENLVALWVKKFQVYPDEAQGATGESRLRLYIDRQGTIRHYFLDGSTGNPALDRAAIDMVRRANPVPALPNDYPEGEQFEFTIPISFKP